MLAGQNQTKNYTGMQQYIDEVQALLAPHRQKKKDPQKFVNKVAAVVRKAYHLTRIGNEQPFMPAFSAEWVSLFHNDGNLAKKFIFNPRPVFFPDKLNDGVYSNRSKNINASILSEIKSISLPKISLSRDNKTSLSSQAAPPIVPISQSNNNLQQKYLTSLLASRQAAPPISMAAASPISMQVASSSILTAPLISSPAAPFFNNPVAPPISRPADPPVSTSAPPVSTSAPLFSSSPAARPVSTSALPPFSMPANVEYTPIIITEQTPNLKSKKFSETIIQFLILGGNLYEQEQPFNITANLLGLGHDFKILDRFDEIYPICNEGMNRSQIFYAALHSIPGFKNKVKAPHGAFGGFDTFVNTEHKNDNEKININDIDNYKRNEMYFHSFLNFDYDKFIGNRLDGIPRARRFGYSTFFDNNIKTVREIKTAKQEFENSYFKYMILSKKKILLIIVAERAFEIIVKRLLETYDTFTHDERIKLRLATPFENIFILYNYTQDNLNVLNVQQQIDAAQNIQFFFTGNISNITNVYNDQNL